MQGDNRSMFDLGPSWTESGSLTYLKKQVENPVFP